MKENLTTEECELARLRLQGLDWNAPAARFGVNAATLPKR